MFLSDIRHREETHRDVLVEVNRVVLDAVGDEEVVCSGQQRHLWDGEDVHELLHPRTLRQKHTLLMFLNIYRLKQFSFQTPPTPDEVRATTQRLRVGRVSRRVRR